MNATPIPGVWYCFNDTTNEEKMRAILNDLISALIGIRMLAKLEAKLGQSRWIEILPQLDDLIERAIATTRQQEEL